MKHARMVGLLAIAVTALMAFAGPASATTVTAPSGTSYTGKIQGESVGEVVLHGVVEITCGKASAEGQVEQHGPGITAAGNVSKLTFSECNQHVTVIKTGSIAVDPVAGTPGAGTIFGSNVRVTVLVTTIFGNVHCVFGSEGEEIHLGVVTPAANNSSNATLDLNSGGIPLLEGSPLCGESSEWTGELKLTAPKGLRID